VVLLRELQGATIFRTDGGEIGISIAPVQVGDYITALSGCLLPSILRREGRKPTYHILGFSHCPELCSHISHLTVTKEGFSEFILV